jgi:spore maturation protein CgeB
MIKRIDLIMPVRSRYGVLHHFTNMLYEALMRAGINCHILVPDKQNPRPFLAQLFNDPPDCTLSFNGVLPDEEDRFLCDMLKIPHICCLVDSPTQFIPLIKSPYNIITCADRSGCEFFMRLHHDKTLFMPHAVEKNLTYRPDAERPYDVVLLGSCIDYKTIEERWNNQYPKHTRDMLYEAAEITLSDQETSYVQALVLATENLKKRHPEIDINTIDFITLLDDLETYVIGYDRVRLVRKIHDARVDIFGSTKENWERYLGSQSNCVIHDAVPFDQACELMKQSKIMLNSCIAIKAGGHERIYAGMAQGAALFASENNFMRETFQDNENILFYTTQSLDSVNDRVNAILADENQRAVLAKKGHDTVMNHHTWDHRAMALLKNISPLIGGQ